MNLLGWLHGTKPEPTPPPPPPPPLSPPSIPVVCPNCQWPDAVILRPTYRYRIMEGRVVAEEAGAALRCARCVHEYAVGISGPYEPRPDQAAQRREAEDRVAQRKREAERLAAINRRDRDQPWTEG